MPYQIWQMNDVLFQQNKVIGLFSYTVYKYALQY